LSLAELTFTGTSSRPPGAPLNTIFVTPASLAPRSFSFPPVWTRPPDMQLATHFTASIFGGAE
jgi:hypothetical protein